MRKLARIQAEQPRRQGPQYLSPSGLIPVDAFTKQKTWRWTKIYVNVMILLVYCYGSLESDGLSVINKAHKLDNPGYCVLIHRITHVFCMSIALPSEYVYFTYPQHTHS